MSAYFNELEPYAAKWLENLSAANHIAPGVIDARSIKEVTADELAGFTQAHFFAGIGVWSHALRLAGWPDDVEVWTGSCPCQPFSAAGRRAGVADARHLWPDWFELIRQRKPARVLGEQVASKDGLAWLDLVQADLEGAGYAVGAFDLCAAGFGAPHIRQRLYFAAIRLADDDEQGLSQLGSQLPEDGHAQSRADAHRRGATHGFEWMGDADGEHPRGDAGASAGAEGGTRLRAVGNEPRASGAARGMGNANHARLEGHGRPLGLDGSPGRQTKERHGPTAGFWGETEWLPCRDGKWRPTEPGLFPLAHGAPQRVGRLRAYGNAIVAPQAVEFIRAVMDVLGMPTREAA